MNDLISIIIPVYNVQQYLNRCIDSVISQTYKNLQIILVDDGSQDACGDICDEYAKNDKRIEVIHKENGGLSDARNAGLDIVKGDYIACIDSDDYISEDYIEYLYKLIKESDTDLSICNRKMVFENNQNIGEITKDYKKIFTPEEAIETMLYQKEFDNSAWGKLFKKQLFNDIRFPKGKLFEDFAIMYNIMSITNKIIYGSKSNYFYCVRENSIMTNKFDLRKMDLIYFSDDMVKFISSKYPKLKDAAIRRYVYSNFHILCQLMYCEPRYIEQENEVINNIKKNANIVLKDKKAYLKDKVAIICLFFGKGFLKNLWGIYKRF